MGSALYVAVNVWQPLMLNAGAWEQGVTVYSFDLADPDAPVARSTLQLSGYGGVVAATDSYLFVATSDPNRPYWTSILHAFDITDTNGVVRPVTEIPLPGRLNDKFKIHQEGDLLATVTEGQSAGNQVWQTELDTYRLRPDAAPEARWTQLGSLQLGGSETLYATRFDGDRLYVVTYLRADPLWVVDFSDPTRPAIRGELQIPGWSTYIEPMGDRLLTVGVDNTSGTRVAVQLFDVADPSAPSLLGKVALGGFWSYGEALNDEKALGVFTNEDLVLIPVSMIHSNVQLRGVQFIDLGRDTLRARGIFESADVAPRRAAVRGNRVLAISNRELLTVDAQDRDNPTLVNSVELSYPVDRVLPVGDWLVEFSGTEVRVSAAANPGTAVRRYQLDDLPVLGATSESNRIHILQGREPTQSLPRYDLMLVPASGASNRLNNATGVLQHVVLDAAHLPDLALAGVASVQTTNQYWFPGAEPLWPEPGLLVWSVNIRQNWGWIYGGPVYGSPVPMPIVTLPVGVAGAGVPGLIAPVVLWRYPFAGSPTELVAVDVKQAEAPRILSETTLDSNVTSASDTFAADGLVFRSHAIRQAAVVATNVYYYTNHVWVTVTNLVWKTNVVSVPVVTTETNRPPAETVDAVKLRWHDPIAGSRFVGGDSFTLGVDGEGVLYAWGDNSWGAVGHGQPLTVAAPTPVPLAPVVGVAAGDWRSYAVDTNGTVWEWGNPNGLTPPSPIPLPDYSVPQSVPLPAPISTIAAGGFHTLALAVDGRLWTWGQNEQGQLGVGNEDAVAGPQPVTGKFTAVAGGWLHSLALDTNGQVFSWGWNGYGQLGRDGSGASPGRVALPDGMKFRQVAAGVAHSLALADDGVVWGWGDNTYDELGTRDVAAGAQPMPVSGLPATRQIACGAMHSLALADNGRVWIFGQDPNSQQPMFARVESLTNVLSVGAAQWHSMALTADGDLFVWGYNLPVIGGSGEAVHLSLAGRIPVVETRTNFVAVTNVIQEEEITRQLRDEIYTNTVRVYRYWIKHYLDVVDYQQDPAAPVIRAPASLPGPLQGFSQGGALLYTLHTDYGDPPAKIPQTILSALAYDGVAAHLVSALTLSTNSNEDAVQTAVRPDGIVVVSRNRWIADGSGRIECWQVDGNGQFGVAGVLDWPTHIYGLRLLDGLAVLRGQNGFGVVDLADPTTPSALLINDAVSCLSPDFTQVAGGRQTGVWAPFGDLGTLPIWRL